MDPENYYVSALGSFSVDTIILQILFSVYPNFICSGLDLSKKYVNKYNKTTYVIFSLYH